MSAEQITIKANATDNDMLELLSYGPGGRVYLFGTIHVDFLWHNRELVERIQDGEAIKFKLEEVT